MSNKLRNVRELALAAMTALLHVCETYGERAFAVAAPRLWNSIPLELRSSSLIDIFKRQLKRYLLMAANLRDAFLLL